jgi:hypothetical protein
MLDFQRASSSLKYPPTKRSQMSEAARRIFAPSSLVTSRVLVADASPSGGGRGQLRRSPFPSLMRLRHPGVKLEHKGHIYFTIVDFFIIQNGCYCIEVIQFWIVPGRSTTWEMGGSQFTKTLCTGLGQTTKNDNGRCAHSRFPGFATIPCMGSW